MVDFCADMAILKESPTPDGAGLETVDFRGDRISNPSLVKLLSKYKPLPTFSAHGHTHGRRICVDQALDVKKRQFAPLKWDQPPIRCTYEVGHEGEPDISVIVGIIGRRGAVMSKDKETLL